MSVLVALSTLILLAAVMAVVSRPLLVARAPKSTPSGGEVSKPVESQAPERDELEAAREAKYREIRDTELDYRTGKLSVEDYQSVNGTLRAEAVKILDRLEALEEGQTTLEEGQAMLEKDPTEKDRAADSPK
jgi:hypothetical protein